MTAQTQSDAAGSAPDLILLGNLLVDDIVLRDGTTWIGEPGGAILHAALAARLWGARVALVSVVGDDYPPATLQSFTERGIDLAGVRKLGRPGGRAWLLHEARIRRVLHHLDCPTHSEISPTFDDIPAEYWGAKAIHLAPMPIARQHDIAARVAERAAVTSTPGPFVSLDPYELVRDDNLEQWSHVLECVDAFFPSEDEMRITGDVEPAMRRIAGPRMRFVALKRGVNGGHLLDLRSGKTQSWTAQPQAAVDVTGAGDAFVGGFLAGLCSDKSTELAIQQGIVAASFAIEDWGARGLLAATPEQAHGRWHNWFGAHLGLIV